MRADSSSSTLGRTRTPSARVCRSPSARVSRRGGSVSLSMTKVGAFGGSAVWHAGRVLLVLWDIDGTLVDSAGHGRRAFEEAFEAVMGVPPADYPGIRETWTSSGLAGRTH